MKLLKTLLLTGVVALALAAAGCDLTFPESVRVKADPTLRIPLGTKTDLLSEAEDFNIDEDIDALVDPLSPDYIEGLSRVEGGDSDDPVTLQFTQSLVDISINDFAGETLDLEQINQTIDPISFTMPEVNFAPETIEESVEPISLTDGMEIPLITIENIPEVDGGPSVVTSPVINASGYTSASFYTGSLVADMSISNASAGLTVQIVSASIMDGAVELASSSNTPVTAPDSVVFGLAGVTLPNSFTIEFELTVSGAPALPGQFDLDMLFDFSADTTIRAATGVEIDVTNSGSVDIPLDTGADFVSARIGEGSVDLALDFPDEWINVNNTITLSLYQGTTFLNSASGSDTVSLDLAGLNIGTGNLRMDYTVTVTGSDASFTADPEVNEITGSASAEITLFDEVVVLAEDVNFSQTISQEIDAETNALVDQVVFVDPYLQIGINNQLPFDIAVSLVSEPLLRDATPVATTFTAGSDTTASPWTVDLLPDDAPNAAENVLLIPPSLTAMDVVLSVTVPGYNEGTGELTLTGIVPGREFSMSGSVSANLAIASVTISTTTHADQYPAAADPGIDFSAIRDVLPDGVDFSGVEAVLNFQADTTGTIDLLLWADDYNGDGLDDYLVGEAGTPAVLTGDPIVINGFEELLNLGPPNLYLYYEIGATGATIDVTGLTDQRISSSLVVTLPLMISAATNVELLDDTDQPVFPTAEEDIFGRDDPEDREDIQETLEMLESITLNVDIENNFGMSLLMRMDDSDRPLDSYVGTGIQKEFTLDSGPQTIGFDRTEMDLITDSPSFRPAFNVYIPAGDHQLNQGSAANPADISISLWMELETNIDYTTGGEE